MRRPPPEPSGTAPHRRARTGRAIADARTLATVIGASRAAFGLGALLGPNTLPHLLIKAEASSPDAVTAWRMTGGRDLVLGAGAALAARRGSPALRGWLGARALVDVVDLATLAVDDALHPLARAATAVVVTVGAVGAVGATLAAGRLPGRSQPRSGPPPFRRRPG